LIYIKIRTFKSMFYYMSGFVFTTMTSLLTYYILTDLQRDDVGSWNVLISAARLIILSVL